MATRATRHAHFAKYKKYYKRRDLLRRYGLTVEGWETMFTQQGRACGACGTTEPGTHKNGWCTDHDHTTGQVRRILCWNCNFALGMVKDSIPHLRSLIAYLEAHGKR